MNFGFLNKQDKTVPIPGKKKENTNSGYSCNKFFNISKPWGYNPEDVDDAVHKYNSLLSKQKSIIIKMKDENIALQNDISRLENELKNMQLELSFTTIPSVTSIQEEFIIDKFEKSFQNYDDNNHKLSNIVIPDSIQNKMNRLIEEEKPSEENTFNLNDYVKEDYKSNVIKINENKTDYDFLEDIIDNEYDCDGDGENDSVYDIPTDNNLPTKNKVVEKSSSEDFIKNYKF